ncbi:Bax inhibitor 1 [Mitosporidium daphniae]|uniref:Bax inhibitor 1 n=1 Tax=Mitosporidium daphniae TaxID=1485682 RepID=A0A098VQX7_9MICR|nr:uncharacterized protein DI09_85p20 [Mitosporidium daphniae]KGG50151.1 hypothetical protein DI09_85p20 [Mitosporidium daphniae]|eukprot:XP_013236590.1 uncharacterized protein DI09_85p20 [Mitosporidium daphniae]
MTASPPPPKRPQSDSQDPFVTFTKASNLYAILFNFRSLATRRQLSRTYATIASSTAFSGLGAYIHIYQVIPYVQGGILSFMVSIFALLSLSFGYPFIRGDPSRATLRVGLLSAFSFAYGLSLGPLLDTLVSISNDSIVPTAFLLTTLIFVSFSSSAIFSQRRSFLFLGGFLMATMSVLTVLGLMNIFIGSPLLFSIDLYAGLIAFCGFLLFDTQVIIERIESTEESYRGTDFNSEYQHDTVQDALKLFMDAVSIFIRLATILAKNSAKKNEDEPKSTRRKMRG